MRHRTLLTLTALLGLAALLSACGNSSSPKSASAGQATPAPTLSDPQFQAAASAAADAVVLTLADLPSGWTSEPHVPDNSDVGFSGECEIFNRDNPVTGSAFGKASDDFSDAADNDAALQLDIFKSAVEAQDSLGRLADLIARCQDQFTTVLTRLMQQDAGSGISNVQVAFRDMQMAALGDETHAYRVSFTFSAAGNPVSFTEAIILIRKGAIIADLSATLEGTGGSFTTGLAQTIADRMTAANNFLPQ